MSTHETTPLIGEKKVKEEGALYQAYRLLVLVFIAFICFGSYFESDTLQPWEANLNQDFNSNDQGFGFLYSIYSFPNFVLPFFGGIIGDKLGLRISSVIFVILVVAGAILSAIAPTLATNNTLSPHNAYILMVFARLIFGAGAETLNVLQSSMVTLWFAGGRALALAMGLVLSVARLGDYIVLSFSANMVAALGNNYIWTFWIGAMLCGGSMVSVILYGLLDKYAEGRIRNPVEIDPNANALNFKAVLRFDARFWIISFLCMSYYSGVFPFVAICTDFLEGKYNYDANYAGKIAGIITLSSLVLSPILGGMLDWVGRRPYFVVLGSLVMIPAHALLAFTYINPIVPIVVIGLSFSLVPSALWPSIPIITKESETATAFGLMTAIQNFGLFMTNLAAGAIGTAYGYNSAMIFFIAMDALGLALGILLIFVDHRKGRQLCGVAKSPISNDVSVN